MRIIQNQYPTQFTRHFFLRASQNQCCRLFLQLPPQEIVGTAFGSHQGFDCKSEPFREGGMWSGQNNGKRKKYVDFLMCLKLSFMCFKKTRFSCVFQSSDEGVDLSFPSPTGPAPFCPHYTDCTCLANR